MEESTSMLKPTVRNLYQFMSVQAELHNPRAAYYYTIDCNNRFLLVKTRGSVFQVNQTPKNAYTLRIIKNGNIQTFTVISQFGETKVYRSGIRVTD